MTQIERRLRDRRKAIWDEAQWLAECVSREDRMFTAGECTRWGWLANEIAMLDSRIFAVLGAP